MGALTRRAPAPRRRRRARAGQPLAEPTPSASRSPCAPRAPPPAPPASTPWHAEIAAADLVVACTGAVGTVVGAEDVAPRAGGAATRAPRPLVVCDLGLPRDVDPRVGEIDGRHRRRPRRPRRAAALGERRARRRGGARGRRRGGARLLRRPAHGRGHARPSPRCAAAPRRSSTPSCSASTAACPTSTSAPASRSPRPCAASSTSSSTPRRCRSSAWRSRPGGDTYAEALRELFELDPQTPAVLAATESNTAHGETVEPGDEVDQALAVDTRGPGGPR